MGMPVTYQNSRVEMHANYRTIPKAPGTVTKQPVTRKTSNQMGSNSALGVRTIQPSKQKPVAM